MQLPSLKTLNLAYHTPPPRDPSTIPHMHLKCSVGHPTLQQIALSHARAIQGIALQYLPCLDYFDVEAADPDEHNNSEFPGLEWVALGRELEDRRRDGRLTICVGPEVSLLDEP